MTVFNGIYQYQEVQSHHILHVLLLTLVTFPAWINKVDLACLLCSSALLYKCEAQRSSCGQCLKAPPAFECGWCTETRKCLLRQHCPSPEQNWMHHGRHNLRCSHPRITKVGNRTCGLNVTESLTDFFYRPIKSVICDEKHY